MALGSNVSRVCACLTGLSSTFNVIHLTPTSLTLQSSLPTTSPNPFVLRSPVLRPQTPLFAPYLRPSCIFCRPPPISLPVLRLLYTGRYPPQLPERTINALPESSHLRPITILDLRHKRTFTSRSADENVTLDLHSFHACTKGSLALWKLSSCRDS